MDSDRPVTPAPRPDAAFYAFHRRFFWIMKGPKIKKSNFNAVIFISIGILMLIFDLWRPQYFYVFIWISMFFIFEGINVCLKNKSLLQFTEHNNWRPLYMLAIGCCLCGFFWEFWNYFSFPKWRYQIPFLGFFICLYLWISLGLNAKIVGLCWLTAGVLYGAYRTSWFRKPLNFVPIENGDDE